MLTRLNDDKEQMACTGCGKPKSACTCGGCRSCNAAMPNLTINIGSNNKKGYNTLNPASIERETLVYPSTGIEQESIPTAGSESIVTPTKSSAQSTYKPRKKRVFLPEFL